MNEIVLAGGCFWGMQELLRHIPGVVETQVGYTGGENEEPTYGRHPGHTEAVRVVFDPARISLEQILDVFFHIHNPTTLNRQGNDIGSSYRSTIFFRTPEQKQIAEQMKARAEHSGDWSGPVVTTLEPYTHFWPAEPEHQDYLQRNPGGYTCHLRRSGTYLV